VVEFHVEQLRNTILSGVGPFMHELEAWDVIRTPLFTADFCHIDKKWRSSSFCAKSWRGENEFLNKKVGGAVADCVETATFTMVPVQSIRVPSFESSSSHTIVGGNASLHWCAVTKDGSVQPS